MNSTGLVGSQAIAGAASVKAAEAAASRFITAERVRLLRVLPTGFIFTPESV
jgi:hypothetical protein